MQNGPVPCSPVQGVAQRASLETLQRKGPNLTEELEARNSEIEIETLNLAFAMSTTEIAEVAFSRT